MGDRHELLAAVAALEATLRHSARLGRENFEENRREIIQLRRDISAKMADVSRLGLALDSAEFRETFRNEFSRMRSAMALHHASWPVVSIDPSDDGYIASIQSSREAYGRFIAWVRAVGSGSSDPGK